MQMITQLEPAQGGITRDDVTVCVEIKDVELPLGDALVIGVES